MRASDRVTKYFALPMKSKFGFLMISMAAPQMLRFSTWRLPSTHSKMNLLTK